MKKLIYFWCGGLRGFDDTEFNFSSKYKIHFDKDTKTLTINRGDENYIDNFYDENIELNVIVGNNGAGKSTLLKKLFNILNSNRIGYFNANILVFEENTSDFSGIVTNFCYRGKYRSNQIFENEKFPIKRIFDELSDYFKISYIENIKTTYITQVLDQELYYIQQNNFSIGGMILYYKEKFNSSDDKIISFFHSQFLNQADFLLDKADKIIGIPFKFSHFVKVKLNYDLYSLFENIKGIDGNMSVQNMVDNFRGIEYDYNTYNQFLEGLLSSFLYNIFYTKEQFYNSEKSFLELIIEIFNGFKEMKYIDEKIDSFFEKMKGKVSVRVEQYQLFLKLFRKGGWIHQKNQPIISFEISLEHIKEFYEMYSKIEQKRPFLEFSWGLSSGENAMLDLYSKFYQIYKSTIKDNEVNFYGKPKYENIILLIDEADAYFHPQWQKDYVRDTLSVAKQIFREFNVQIILATHSPIMLSDIPKQNVLYLKKEENAGTKVVPREERQETFGANIFSLFKDTFFLEGSGIGSFAEENLEELLKRIHDLKEINEEDIEYIKKRIMMIGDPFVRQKFENEFCICIEKKDSQRSLDEKIRFFEKEIESLKKQKERDKNDKD